MHPQTYCFLILQLFYQTDGHKEDTKKGGIILFLSKFYKISAFLVWIIQNPYHLVMIFTIKAEYNSHIPYFR